MIVIHYRDHAAIHPATDLAELCNRLYLGYVYTETLGNQTYEHYDCAGVRRKRQCD